MATRPCYRPLEAHVGVKTMESPQFEWHGGFAFSQKQKNVIALHEALQAADRGARILEISSKSLQPLGVKLSAFNLTLKIDGVDCTVESVFQASKVFEGGVGPFPENYPLDSREVRHFVQAASEGKRLVAFDWNGTKWPLEPRTGFFFRLYIEALRQNPDLADRLMDYNGFTDIEFNPKRQVNCQAAASAFYISLRRSGRLEELLADRDAFCRAVGDGYRDETDASWSDVRVISPAKASVIPNLPAAGEHPAMGDRIPCPEDFVDAKLFVDKDGVIENWSKSEDPGIVRLWIPQDVKTIGNFAFKGCPNLEEVVCEECAGGPALSLGLMCFAGCGKLRKVSLPTRLASVGKGAFRDNAALTEFSVATGHYPITCADHAFDNCPDGMAKLAVLKS